MKSGRWFVSVLLLGNLGVLSALSLHVVRSPQASLSFVPKSQLTLVDTYVDLTNRNKWTVEEWPHHMVLMESLAEAGKGQWIQQTMEVESMSCPACGAGNACQENAAPSAKPAITPAPPAKPAQPSAASAVRAVPATQPAAQTPSHAPKSIFDFGDN